MFPCINLDFCALRQNQSLICLGLDIFSQAQTFDVTLFHPKTLQLYFSTISTVSINLEKANGKYLDKKNVGTDGYQVQARKKLWVPMGTGYRPDKKLWVPMSSGFQQKKFWVPMGTGYQLEKIFRKIT